MQMETCVLDLFRTVEFLQEVLADQRTLARLLLPRIDWAKGHFFTFLPAGLSDERVHRFQVGDIVPPVAVIYHAGQVSKELIAPCLNDEFASYLHEQMQRYSDALLILDTFYYPEEAEDGLGEDVGIAVYNREVYYYLFGHPTVEQVERTVSHAYMYPSWFGILAGGMVEPKWGELRIRLDLGDIERILSRVQLFFISAYDEEGYVFWEPKQER